ncbi:RNA ligase family protein [Nocardiopsis sp. RV163]|uniref:RNA ligase family protein n=1 Tax=Nocardiopsis sp. RV163 TaxID=1661388 RepID=UPI00064C2F8A|nr:RNA ligase family protein [Nocardiopsis sp. RV163]
MTDSDLRALDLPGLNFAAKYPSIPTYHTLDPRNGGLLEEATAFTGDVVLTEKVDGVNARIVSFPSGDYVLGGREELLYARGDLVGNPALGVVDALRALVGRITPPASGIAVHYLEVYGGRVTAASREYTGDRAVGYRMFDSAAVPAEVLSLRRREVSAWREAGGQGFLPEDALLRLAEREGVGLTPRLATVPADEMPQGVVETSEFVAEHLPGTRVALDGGAGGRAEGVVLRTTDRSVIAKARFQDYRRTLKRRSRRG